MQRFFKNRMFVSVLLSVVLTFAFVFAITYGATIISTSITTTGDLTVSGLSTFTNASTTQLTISGTGTYLLANTASSTFSGLLNLSNASTTQLTTFNNTYLATTGGNIGIGTTSPFTLLSVGGAAGTLTGNGYFSGLLTSTFASSSVLTVSNTASTTNFFTTYASTTGLTVFDDAYLATVGGNVGIGTTSPFTLLSVGGAAGTLTGNGYFSGKLTSAFSSSTALTVSGTASSTNLIVSNLSTFLFASSTAFSATNINVSGDTSLAGSFNVKGLATTTVTGIILLVNASTTGSAPASCSPSLAGGLAYTTKQTMCICNGAIWILATSTTAAACSW